MYPQRGRPNDVCDTIGVWTIMSSCTPWRDCRFCTLLVNVFSRKLRIALICVVTWHCRRFDSALEYLRQGVDFYLQTYYYWLHYVIKFVILNKWMMCVCRWRGTRSVLVHGNVDGKRLVHWSLSRQHKYLIFARQLNVNECCLTLFWGRINSVLG